MACRAHIRYSVFVLITRYGRYMKCFKSLLVVLAILIALLNCCLREALAAERTAPGPLPNFDQRRNAPPKLKAPSQERKAAAVQLRQRVPGLRLEMDEVLDAPKHVSSAEGFLSGPHGEGKSVSNRSAQRFAFNDPHRPVKAFLHEHAALYGHGAE